MFGNDTLFLQRFLKVAGYDPGPIDGQFGQKTAAALERFRDASDAVSAQYRRLDSRSEGCILTLLPGTQKAARKFMDLAQSVNLGATVKIISGTRTYREQAAIFAQGRTRPGRIVTKAGPGQSNHNFGLAFDVGLFDGQEYVDREKPYETLGRFIGDKVEGLEWGIRVNGDIDRPHYQIRTGLALAALRKHFEAGDAYA